MGMHALLPFLEALKRQRAYVACCNTTSVRRFLEKLSTGASREEDALIAISEGAEYASCGEA